MNYMLLNLMSITVLTAYIIDLSGFTDTWKGWLGRWLGCEVGRVRPIDCSLCMTWWLGIIYLLCTQSVTLPNIAIVAGFSFMASPIGQALILAKELIVAVIGLAHKLIDKLWQY